MKNFAKAIKFILWIIVIILIFITINIIFEGYRQNFFNEFTKAEYNLNTSTFARDSKVTYKDNVSSYKIESNTWNDAMFYKEIAVEPNTAYKVTCMVKTQDVKTKEDPSESGAHIAISGTTEKSESITGTADWQEISMYFNSRNRTSVKIAFRLGGYEDNCTGTAWFSDFKVEQGYLGNNTTWNIGCFIFENINVNINDKQVKVAMNSNEIANIKSDIVRYAKSCEAFSNWKIDIEYDIIEITEPITSIANDEANGYFIAGKNISNLIDKYLEGSPYQHIFAIVQFGDLDKNMQIPVNDWLGLGSMTYRGVGFSNILIPEDYNNKFYQYSYNNTFPEEVLVHEFLHDLERISKEEGYTIPALHDHEKYGYKNEKRIGLKNWYKDYMSQNIKDTESGSLVGLYEDVYKMKPVGEENFTYTVELDFIKEPSNIIEEIILIAQTTIKVYSRLME